MHNTKKITEDLFFLGVNDRRLELFENVFPISRGVSYNSYLLKDEKTVLLDTVDKSALEQFLENLEFELDGRKLDYLIITHMEPDHAATIQNVAEKYSEVKIVCNAKAKQMMKQFFDFDVENRTEIIKEGDTLVTGKHTLTFIMAPMVHWPEAMVTYDLTDKTLFSADAFGTFGALNGNLFADEVDFENDWLDDARRYYTNIVGKYGNQVQALLKKAATVEIKMICPLHGPVWRNKTDWFIEKYQKWSTYESEEETVLIIYGSVYGHTENVAEMVASELADKGIKNIKMYDVSKTHFSVIVAEAFRCSHIVIASTTYNAGIFCNMHNVLSDLKAIGLKNRKVAIIENGTWAPTAGSLVTKILSDMVNMEVIAPVLTIKSSFKNEQEADLNAFVEAIYSTIGQRKIRNNPMSKIGYGLYVLTAKDGEKDNGCIINTVNQIDENTIAISVNNENLTCEMVEKTKEFNISVLTEETPFTVFKNFGYQSGRTCDKFENFCYVQREDNGIYSLKKYTNAIIIGKVISSTKYGNHTLFIAQVENSKVISDVLSVTYEYYLSKIKPVVRPERNVKGFICKICGYIYEGSELPKDFICPICKHGAEDFEPIKN